jgi:hypothetical protein
MDNQIIAALIGAGGALVGSLIGASLTYLFTIKQFRKEQEEILRAENLKKRTEAHREFSALLRPTSENAKLKERIVIRKENRSYLNANAAEKFFESIHEFVYTGDGASLSKELRQKVIPDARQFIMGIVKNGKPDSNGWIAINQTQAKKTENALHWIRHRTQKDGGLTDLDETE